MPPIPWPTNSSPGARPQEGAGRLVNCYAVKNEDAARFPLLWKRSPGLLPIVDVSAHSNCRGMHFLFNTTLLVVYSERVYSVTLSGETFTATNLGALAGTELVTIASNNASPTPNIVAVTENGAFNLFTGSAPTAFADSDLPAPNSVCQHRGYFIFSIGDGRIFASDLNSVSVNSLSFATAQGRSDGLIRVVSFGDDMLAFGPRSTEIFRDVGTSPFPLEFQKMLPRGLLGPNAVAGWEEGFADELLWGADDDTVVRYNGWATPVPVSNADVSRAIASATDKSLLEASVYVVGGNAFWALSSPGEWTWEYNLTTQRWNERESYEQDDWRVPRTIRAFDRWMAGDRDTGDLAEIREDCYTEFNEPLVWQLRSGPFKQFPSRSVVHRADFDFTAATGVAAGEDPIETDPRVSIRWSNDGGYTFGNGLYRNLGGEGVADTTVTINRLGQVGPKGIVVDLSISDPIHVGFLGGAMAVEQRAE